MEESSEENTQIQKDVLFTKTDFITSSPAAFLEKMRTIESFLEHSPKKKRKKKFSRFPSYETVLDNVSSIIQDVLLTPDLPDFDYSDHETMLSLADYIDRLQKLELRDIENLLTQSEATNTDQMGFSHNEELIKYFFLKNNNNDTSTVISLLNRVNFIYRGVSNFCDIIVGTDIPPEICDNVRDFLLSVMDLLVFEWKKLFQYSSLSLQAQLKTLVIDRPREILDLLHSIFNPQNLFYTHRVYDVRPKLFQDDWNSLYVQAQFQQKNIEKQMSKAGDSKEFSWQTSYQKHIFATPHKMRRKFSSLFVHNVNYFGQRSGFNLSVEMLLDKTLRVDDRIELIVSLFHMSKVMESKTLGQFLTIMEDDSINFINSLTDDILKHNELEKIKKVIRYYAFFIQKYQNNPNSLFEEKQYLELANKLFVSKTLELRILGITELKNIIFSAVEAEAGTKTAKFFFFANASESDFSGSGSSAEGNKILQFQGSSFTSSSGAQVSKAGAITTENGTATNDKTGNSSKGDASAAANSVNNPPAHKTLPTKYLLKWINDNLIIEHILNDGHKETLKQTKPIFIFLLVYSDSSFFSASDSTEMVAEERQTGGKETSAGALNAAGQALKKKRKFGFGKDEIDLIWDSIVDKHETTQREILGLIVSLVPFMNLTCIERFFDKILTIRLKKLKSKYIVNFICQFTSAAVERCNTVNGGKKKKNQLQWFGLEIFKHLIQISQEAGIEPGAFVISEPQYSAAVGAGGMVEGSPSSLSVTLQEDAVQLFDESEEDPTNNTIFTTWVCSYLRKNGNIETMFTNLAELVERPSFEAKRKNLMKWCVQNIESNFAVIESMKLLRHIILQYPLTAHGDAVQDQAPTQKHSGLVASKALKQFFGLIPKKFTIPIAIEYLCEKCKLMDTIFENFVHYKSIVEATSSSDSAQTMVFEEEFSDIDANVGDFATEALKFEKDHRKKVKELEIQHVIGVLKRRKRYYTPISKPAPGSIRSSSSNLNLNAESSPQPYSSPEESTRNITRSSSLSSAAMAGINSGSTLYYNDRIQNISFLDTAYTHPEHISTRLDFIKFIASYSTPSGQISFSQASLLWYLLLVESKNQEEKELCLQFFLGKEFLPVEDSLTFLHSPQNPSNNPTPRRSLFSDYVFDRIFFELIIKLDPKDVDMTKFKIFFKYFIEINLKHKKLSAKFEEEESNKLEDMARLHFSKSARVARQSDEEKKSTDLANGNSRELIGDFTKKKIRYVVLDSELDGMEFFEEVCIYTKFEDVAKTAVELFNNLWFEFSDHLQPIVAQERKKYLSSMLQKIEDTRNELSNNPDDENYETKERSIIRSIDLLIDYIYLFSEKHFFQGHGIKPKGKPLELSFVCVPAGNSGLEKPCVFRKIFQTTDTMNKVYAFLFSSLKKHGPVCFGSTVSRLNPNFLQVFVKGKEIRYLQDRNKQLGKDLRIATNETFMIRKADIFGSIMELITFQLDCMKLNPLSMALQRQFSSNFFKMIENNSKRDRTSESDKKGEPTSATSERDEKDFSPDEFKNPEEEEFVLLSCEDENTYPTKLLSTQENFELLSSLLGLNSEKIIKKGWLLILHLPTNQYLKNKILHFFDNPDTEKLNWNEVLPNSSIYKLLYSLQIIESFIQQQDIETSDVSPQEIIHWQNNFIKRGGLDHLIELVLSTDSHNSLEPASHGQKRRYSNSSMFQMFSCLKTQSSLFKECFALLIKLISFFLPKLFEGNQDVIQRDKEYMITNLIFVILKSTCRLSNSQIQTGKDMLKAQTFATATGSPITPQTPLKISLTLSSQLSNGTSNNPTLPQSPSNKPMELALPFQTRIQQVLQKFEIASGYKHFFSKSITTKKTDEIFAHFLIVKNLMGVLNAVLYVLFTNLSHHKNDETLNSVKLIFEKIFQNEEFRNYLTIHMLKHPSSAVRHSTANGLKRIFILIIPFLQKERTTNETSVNATLPSSKNLASLKETIRSCVVFLFSFIDRVEDFADTCYQYLELIDFLLSFYTEFIDDAMLSKLIRLFIDRPIMESIKQTTNVSPLDMTQMPAANAPTAKSPQTETAEKQMSEKTTYDSNKQTKKISVSFFLEENEFDKEQNEEDNEEICDYLLLGLLKVIKTKLKNMDVQKKKYLGCSFSFLAKNSLLKEEDLTTVNETDAPPYFGLVSELFEKCLFKIPDATTLENPPPKCKTEKTRAAAIDLLVELVKGCPEATEELFSLLIPFIEQNRIIGSNILQKGYFSPNNQPLTWSANRYRYNYYANFLGKVTNNGFVGLKNLGATCYLNSLMQQLYMTVPFRKGLLRFRLHPKQIEDNELVFKELQILFGHLQESVKKFYNPKIFCSTYRDFEGNSINTAQQQDANEFFNFFFDKIDYVFNKHEKYQAQPAKNLLKRVFGGRLMNQIIYEEKPISEHFEPFYHISLDLKNKSNIEESLELFMAGERLDGDNSYYYEKIDAKVPVVKRSLFYDLPNIMVLHLKRFEFDYEKRKNLKINDRCEFPLQLNMKPYTIQGVYEKEKRDIETLISNGNIPPPEVVPTVPGLAADDYFEYKLVGVLVHSGSADSGHYYSYALDRSNTNSNSSYNGQKDQIPSFLNTQEFRESIDERENDLSDDKWYEFNDTNVKVFDVSNLEKECFGGYKEVIDTQNQVNSNGQITQKKVKTKIFKTNNAYMLFYQRVSTVKLIDDFEDQFKVVDYNNPAAKNETIVNFEEVKRDLEQRKNYDPEMGSEPSKNNDLLSDEANSSKKPVEISPEIQELIHQDNSTFFYDRILFSPEFDNFLFRFIKSCQEEQQVPAKSQEIQKYFVVSKLNEKTIFDFIVDFLSHYQIHSYYANSSLPKWFSHVKNLLEKNPEFCYSFLERFSDRDPNFGINVELFEVLVRCPLEFVRNNFSLLALLAIRTIKERSENQEIVYIPDDEKPRDFINDDMYTETLKTSDKLQKKKKIPSPTQPNTKKEIDQEMTENDLQTEGEDLKNEKEEEMTPSASDDDSVCSYSKFNEKKEKKKERETKQINNKNEQEKEVSKEKETEKEKEENEINQENEENEPENEEDEAENENDNEVENKSDNENEQKEESDNSKVESAKIGEKPKEKSKKNSKSTKLHTKGSKSHKISSNDSNSKSGNKNKQQKQIKKQMKMKIEQQKAALGISNSPPTKKTPEKEEPKPQKVSPAKPLEKRPSEKQLDPLPEQQAPSSINLHPREVNINDENLTTNMDVDENLTQMTEYDQEEISAEIQNEINENNASKLNVETNNPDPNKPSIEITSPTLEIDQIQIPKRPIHPVTKFLDSIVAIVASHYLQDLESNCVQLFSFLSEFTELGFEERKYFAKRKIVSNLVRLLDIVARAKQQHQSLQQQLNAMNSMNNANMNSNTPNMGGSCSLGQTQNPNMSSFYFQRSIRSTFSELGLFMAIQTISVIVKTCETLTTSASMPPTMILNPKNKDRKKIELFQEDRDKFFNKTFFSNLLKEGINSRALKDVLIHWCWENLVVSESFGKLVISFIKDIENPPIPMTDAPNSNPNPNSSSQNPNSSSQNLTLSSSSRNLMMSAKKDINLIDDYFMNFIEILRTILTEINDSKQKERTFSVLDHLLNHLNQNFGGDEDNRRPTALVLKMIREAAAINTYIWTWMEEKNNALAKLCQRKGIKHTKPKRRSANE